MKSDITLSKSMLLCPVQFENIKPNISITLKDINIENFAESQALLEEISENLFKIQVSYNYMVYKKIKSDGLDKFSQNVYENIDEIVDNLEKNMNGLIKISKNLDKELF